MALQIRRGTEAERTAGGGVVFAEGELIYVTDTDSLYVGDGSTAGGVLLTGSALATIGDYIVADTINSTLDLQQNLDLNGSDIIGTGNINITGDITATNITATGVTEIGDAPGDTLAITAQVNSGITPETDTAYDLGTVSKRWRNLYANGATIDGQIDAVAINADVIADNSTVMIDVSANTFTGDLTGDTAGTHTGAVIGNVTGNTTGYHLGDVKGSIFGDDSTPIIDAVSNTINGNLTGNVTGNVTGNLTGNVTGDLTGQVKGTGGSNVLSPNTGTTDAELSVLNVTAGGTISGNVSGNLTGNAAGDHTGTFTGVITATGTLDGDITGSVFADDSTPMVDAITKTFTGNLTGNVTGNITGNIFTNLIDSDDSSEISVVPALRTQSDLTVENSLFVGAGGIVLQPDGVMNVATVKAAIITDNGFGSVFVDTSLELSGGITSPGLGRFLDTVDILWLNDSDGKTLTVQKFTGDVDSEIETADPNNYSVYAEISDSKAEFGVPVKFPVVADDSARSTLVASPEKGMVILMEAGTTPAATNQLQFFDGSNWVNV